MRDIISLLFLLLFVIIRAAFCGYTTKTINESKGYTGGFWMGVLLAELGILIAVFKKELPDAPPNSYRVVSVVKVLKKFHYPFVSPQVEPIDILKGNIYAEGEAAKVNLVFWLIHGMFMLAWYSVILGAYLWYIIGYTIYWLFKYKLFKKGTAEDSVSSTVNAQSIKDSVVGGIGGLKERAGSTASKLSQKTEGIKTGAAEKATLAKEKAGAAFTGVKGKASEFAAEHKKTENNAASSVDVIEEASEASITSTGANAAKKALDTSISTSETISEASESSSFDELYEKAMNTADEEVTDESAFSEVGAEESYNGETVNEVNAPVAASMNPAPTPTITQQPAPSQYDNSEKKKSPVVFVLVGVIAVLLVGMGILGGMLLTKNKDDKGSDNSSDNEVIASTTDSVPVTTSKITTTTQEAATNVPVFSDDEIGRAKDNAVADLKNNLKTVFSDNGVNLPELNTTTDYDINGDDIPELIISYMGISDTTYNIYYYDGSKFTELKDCWGGLDISEEKHLICERHYGGGEVSCYYEISNDYKISKIDEISSFPEQGGTGYYRNGQKIDTSEYYAAINYYNDMNWISITSDKLNVENSDSNESTGNASNSLSMYSGYSNIENAPSDMTFVDNTNSNAIPKGIIKTDSTGLNLRTGPEKSYEVILEIPKGDSVSVYGQNSEWCYVGWKAPTKTVDGSYPIFYGYVNKQYVSFDTSISSQITPVEKYGTIYSPAGNKVNGYDKSFLIDGGARAFVRQDLTHGWHIKAVNKYYNGINDWYELYDADDGDYYGWVNEEAISFY